MVGSRLCSINAAGVIGPFPSRNSLSPARGLAVDTASRTRLLSMFEIASTATQQRLPRWNLPAILLVAVCGIDSCVSLWRPSRIKQNLYLTRGHLHTGLYAGSCTHVSSC